VTPSGGHAFGFKVASCDRFSLSVETVERNVCFMTDILFLESEVSLVPASDEILRLSDFPPNYPTSILRR